MNLEYTGRKVWFLEVLTDLMVYTDKLLRKHNITYWFDCGNLLGALRNGQHIPWDNDVDISCFESDVSKLVALKDEIKADGFNSTTLYDKQKRLHAFVIWKHNPDFHVDIWPCYIEDGIVINIHIPYFFCVPLEDVLNMSEINFEGAMYPCPRNVEKLIVSRYGPDWRTHGIVMTSSIKKIKKYDPANLEILNFVSHLELSDGITKRYSE